MMNSFFSQEQVFPFYVSIVFLFLSIILYKKSFLFSCLTLGTGILSMSYFAGMLDPFLNTWDEQFHALVAKNSTENFLHPKLFREHLLPYDYRIWGGNLTWLHKQPLFIWQIATSIELFGVNVFAIRFPSILMHAIISLFVFRMGFILINRRVGYIAALFFGVAYFPLELVTGFLPSDHNDVAFMFYVTGSIWSFVEYRHSKNIKWLILIGLFSGCAILVKWLVGLLVFFPWGIITIRSIFKKKETLKTFTPLLLSLGICILIFLPWQIYIQFKFPLEAVHEATYNVRHFSEILEGHGGSWTFYFNKGLKSMYGSADLVPYFILLSIVLFVRRIEDKSHRIFIVASITVVYLFYSLAATKMLSFVVIVSPLVFIAIGSLVDLVLVWFNSKFKKEWLEHSLFIILIVFMAYSFLNLSKIENNHTLKNVAQNNSRLKKLNELKVIGKIKNDLGRGNYVVFYSKENFENISMMFFTDYLVYNRVPTTGDIELILKMNYTPVIIESETTSSEILNNKKCRFIKGLDF